MLKIRQTSGPGWSSFTQLCLAPMREFSISLNIFLDNCLLGSSTRDTSLTFLNQIFRKIVKKINWIITLICLQWELFWGRIPIEIEIDSPGNLLVSPAFSSDWPECPCRSCPGSSRCYCCCYCYSHSQSQSRSLQSYCCYSKSSHFKELYFSVKPLILAKQ